MRRAVIRWLAVTAVAGPVAMLAAGCVGEGGFARQEPPGMDFYEPYGAEYGDYSSGFEIGPFSHFDDFGRGRGRFGGGFGGRGVGFR